MRFPKATLALALLIAGAYFFLSGGAPYISDARLQELAFHYTSLPAGLVTHAFVHVGAAHLAGNLVPLLAFGAVLESAVSSFDVVLLFFLSAAFSTSIFSTYSSAFLVGASAGIAGLMGAALALRPKKAAVVALAVPVVLWLLLPAVSQAVASYSEGLSEEKSLLEKNISALLAENRTVEAVDLNRTAAAVGERLSGVEKGVVREAITPSDLMVHAYAAVFGVFYVFFLKRKQFREGAGELASLGGGIGSSAKAIKSAFAKKIVRRRQGR